MQPSQQSPIMRHHLLSESERGRIIGMHEGHLTAADISQKLSISKSTVYKVISKFNKSGIISASKAPGRAKKLSEGDREHLENLLKDNRRAPLADIISGLNVEVGATTMRREIHQLGYHSRIAVRKPFLNDKQTAKRLNFAALHQHWTVDDWMKVIWTDESSFEVGKNFQQIRVWRKNNEQYKSECLAPTFKSGRSSVMIWGAFTGTAKLDLVFMKPKQRTGSDFVEQVYNTRLGPFLESQPTSFNAILMEDGAPVHRCLVSKAWREARSIEKLDWPANSPDLNPIENVWGTMKQSIVAHEKPSTIDQMRITIQSAWDSITTEKLHSLVASMPARMQAVVDQNGGHTEW